jgi:hypothetical protein
MLDIFRLNVLLQDLLTPSDVFDPAVAMELFQSIPEEKHPFLIVKQYKKKNNKGITGMTNMGQYTLNDKDETYREYNNTKGVWIGRYRIIHTPGQLKIEPRFNERGLDNFYIIFLDRKGKLTFKKSHLFAINIPFPRWEIWKRWGIISFVLPMMKEWKKPKLNVA